MFLDAFKNFHMLPPFTKTSKVQKFVTICNGIRSQKLLCIVVVQTKPLSTLDNTITGPEGALKAFFSTVPSFPVVGMTWKYLALWSYCTLSDSTPA